MVNYVAVRDRLACSAFALWAASRHAMTCKPSLLLAALSCCLPEAGAQEECAEIMHSFAQYTAWKCEQL